MSLFIETQKEFFAKVLGFPKQKQRFPKEQQLFSKQIAKSKIFEAKSEIFEAKRPKPNPRAQISIKNPFR